MNTVAQLLSRITKMNMTHRIQLHAQSTIEIKIENDMSDMSA